MQLKPSALARAALAIVVVGSLALSAGSAQAIDGSPDTAPPAVSEDQAIEQTESDEAVDPEPGDGSGSEGAVANELEAEEGPEGSEQDGQDPEDESDLIADPEPTAPAPPPLPAPLTSAPEQLEVRGSLLIIPDDSGMTLLRGGQAPAADHGENHGDRILLATTAGPVLDISAVLPASLVNPGAEFVGTVTLPEVSREAIAAELTEQPQLESDEALEIAAEAIAEVVPDGSQDLVVAEGDIVSNEASGIAASLAQEAAPAGAMVPRGHTADIVYYPSSRNRTEASLRSLVTNAGVYWNKQTEGGISGITVGKDSFKKVTGTTFAQRCSYENLWAQAAKLYGRTADDYSLGNQDARHLIVFVDDDCGPAADDAIGWGSMGYPHQGGTIWVDLGALSNGGPAFAVDFFAQTLAHEIGHNLGLGHSNLRLCAPATRSRVTTPDSSIWFDRWAYKWKTTDPNCGETEYGDVWSVMGAGYIDEGKKPSTLGANQKDALGVWKPNTLKNVTSNGGLVQTVKINAASATDGIRGVKVAGPVETGEFYLEYRNGLGQDNGQAWGTTNQQISFWDNTIVGRGVQVLKMNKIQFSNTLRSNSVAIPNFKPSASGGNYVHTLAKGDVSIPSGDRVKVTVTGLTTTQATVKIEYKSFSPGTRNTKISVAQKGSLVPGKTLSAKTAGAWTTPAAWAKPSKITDKYQWLRNGKAIWGATGATYRPTKADIGANVSLRILPSASGFMSGKAITSNGIKVNATPFIDVAYGHKFYADIEWMKLSGTSTGTRTKKGAVYGPKSGVTREAMAAFMFRLAGAKSKKFKAPKKSPFIDVPTNHKFYKQIAWMYSAKLSTGIRTPNGRAFDPSANISREAMAAFLYRSEKGKGGKTGTTPFSDVPKGSKFAREIAWMHSAGISTGVRQKGKKPVYLPKDDVSREAMAAFLHRLKTK